MEAFPTEDLTKDLEELDLRQDLFPLQRSLGMLWDVNTDTFTFRVSTTVRPYTKRGVLSTVNSIFDPMEFIAPVVVEGKCILRDLVSENVKWDDTLPPEYYQKWANWKNSLQCLEQLQIPRTILPMSFNDVETKELHVFVDASERVIAASLYMKTVHCADNPYHGFVLGKAKVAPCHGHTIPRLKLCAAVLGIDIALLVTCHMNMSMDHVQYHTDSKIVLRYITNRTKRFSVYVTNRVEKIRRCSNPSQWRYVSTSTNPADQATRPVSAISLNGNAWLVGSSTNLSNEEENEISLDVDIEKDMEFKSDVTVTVTKVCSHKILGSYRFERFSRWDTLVRSFARLKALAKSYHKNTKVHTEIPIKHPLLEAEMYLIRVVQQEEYKREYECIASRSTISRDSSIISLSPELDSDGMLWVKGRLSNSQLSSNEKYPLIIPGKHHVATLLVRHYHEKVHHQGRHFMEGAIIAAGLWITGAKRLVSSVIHQCVTCRKLRGKHEQQIMSDLPQDRVVPAHHSAILVLTLLNLGPLLHEKQEEVMRIAKDGQFFLLASLLELYKLKWWKKCHHLLSSMPFDDLLLYEDISEYFDRIEEQILSELLRRWAFTV